MHPNNFCVTCLGTRKHMKARTSFQIFYFVAAPAYFLFHVINGNNNFVKFLLEIELLHVKASKTGWSRANEQGVQLTSGA